MKAPWRSKILRFAQILCALLLLTLGRDANAAQSGSITGTVTLWNINGGYCSTAAGADCTGTRHPVSLFRSWVPTANAVVKVVDQAGALIGQGVTDDNGNYTVQWYTSTTVSQVRIQFYLYHKDARFWLAYPEFRS